MKVFVPVVTYDFDFFPARPVSVDCPSCGDPIDVSGYSEDMLKVWYSDHVCGRCESIIFG